jgi:dienelactone hydrolase
MGGSKGGGVAFYVAWNPLRIAIAKDHEFAAHIPLYPACVYWEKKDFSRKPIMMMLVAKDNYTGVQHCVESMKEIQNAGYDNIEVKLYPGAYHAFDGDGGIRQNDRGYSFVDCRFTVRADGRDFASGMSMDTVDNKRKAIRGCATKGVTLGGNLVMGQAMTDVRQFLTKALLQ